MMNRFTYTSNSELARLIDEWVKSEFERRLMKRRLIDGIKYEPLAEEFDISVWWAKKLVAKNTNILLEMADR